MLRSAERAETRRQRSNKPVARNARTRRETAKHQVHVPRAGET
jgi:hypothetical protein